MSLLLLFVIMYLIIVYAVKENKENLFIFLSTICKTTSYLNGAILDLSVNYINKIQIELSTILLLYIYVYIYIFFFQL